MTINIFCAHSKPLAFPAAATRVTVQDVVPFDALIAYPTDTAEVPFQAGPFTVTASRDAPIAAGGPFPVVLFSHGNGRSGGSALIHRDLIASLARQGFIVVAPSHPGTGNPLEDRPRQLHKALDRLLHDPRFEGRADPARLGMIGYSFGGAVGLIAAGAVPSLAHLSAYCSNRTDDFRACDDIPTVNLLSDSAIGKSADALAVKAIVLMEPFGALFDHAGLASLEIPALLYHAEQSDLALEGNVFALASALPRPPQQETVAGGHFVFVDPCPDSVEKNSPEVCKDSAGVNRLAIHQQMEATIGAFLRKSLQASH